MKKIFYSLLFMFVALTFTGAQVQPNWQGVLRGADNKPVKDANVSVRFTITQGGTTLYQETHMTKTTGLGLINLKVCGGTRVSGSCANIGNNPSGGPTMLKVEIDPAGGSAYKDFGTAPLGGTFMASFALNDKVNDADADPTNEIQSISVKDGDKLVLSKQGGEVTMDPDTSNELQMLSIKGNLLTISNGNTVRIPKSSQDADFDPTNELQALRRDGDKILLVPKGGSVTDKYKDDDADPTNEFQELSFSGTELSLSNGNTVDLKSIQKQPDTIWKENGNLVWWNDVTKNTRIQFGSGGLQFRQGNNSEYVNSFRSSNVQEYLKWNTLDFIPNTSYYKRGRHMYEHPKWYQGDYWQVDENKLVDLRVYHYQNGKTNGYSTSQMVFSTGLDATSMLPNVFIGGAGTGSVLLLDPQDPTSGIAGFAFVNGRATMFAQSKNFVEVDPRDKSKRIWYTAIEGPEAAMYDRGTAKLEGGRTFVPFRGHFKAMAAGAYTVMLTPLSASSKGMAVVKKSKDGFEVVELFGGKGDYSFDWEVKAVRKGYEDFKVVRDAASTNIEALQKDNLDRIKAMQDAKK